MEEKKDINGTEEEKHLKRHNRYVQESFYLKFSFKLKYDDESLRTAVIEGRTTGINVNGTAFRGILPQELKEFQLYEILEFLSEIKGVCELKIQNNVYKDIPCIVVRAGNSWEKERDVFIAVRFLELPIELKRFLEDLSLKQETMENDQRHKQQIYNCSAAHIPYESRTEYNKVCAKIQRLYGLSGCFKCRIPDCINKAKNIEIFNRLFSTLEIQYISEK